MTSPFDISTPNTTVKVTDKRKAVANFSVTNKSTAVIKGRATVNTDMPEQAKWFTVSGEAERTLPVNGKQNYSVQVNVPPDVAPGSYPARLHMVDVSNPDEVFSQSATIMFEVAPPKPAGKGFPIWIPIVAGVVVLAVVGAVLALLLLGGDPKVPDVVGMQVAKAEKAISDAGFKVGKVDFVVIDNEENQVVEQSLEAAKPAKKETVIDLKVIAPKVTIPDFKGQNFDEVQKKLTELKLTVGPSIQKTTGQSEKSVLEHNPVSGTKVLQGTQISFVVESPLVIVPATLVGKDVSIAQETLTKAGLILGSIETRQTGKAAGTILDTNPKAGVKVANGTVVNLVIEITPIKTPAVKSLDQASAAAKITAGGFTVGKISFVTSRDVKKGIVLSQSPEANVAYNFKAPIDLTISAEPADLHSRGITLAEGFTLDFDKGTIGLPSTNTTVDVVVQNGFLSPRNNARITLMNGKASPEYLDCKNASYPTSSIALSNLTSSNSFCIRTNEGRFGAITEFSKIFVSDKVTIGTGGAVNKGDQIVAKPLYSTAFHTWKEPKDEFVFVGKPILTEPIFKCSISLTC
jgi:beta-lactam-binding protein with PASTA domain